MLGGSSCRSTQTLCNSKIAIGFVGVCASEDVAGFILYNSGGVTRLPGSIRRFRDL